MNVLSLFDGMSCGQIALNRLGILYENYYAAEINKYSIQVTQANYPYTIQMGSVTDVKGANLPHIDLLMGGSPCQSFSFAGKRKGMSTKCETEILTLEQYLDLKEEGYEFEGQSYLFWEYMRLLNEVKPTYFLLENVTMEEKWKNTLTKAIGVEPILIDSSLVSAQNRKRLYWTNIPGITQPEDKNLYLKDIVDYSAKNRIIVDRTRIKNMWESKNYLQYDLTGKGHKSQDQRGYYLDAKHGTLPSHGASSKVKVVLENGDIVQLLPIECERLQTVPDNYTNYVSDAQRYAMLGNGWTVDVIAHILKNI